MTMQTFNIHEAKTHLSRLVEDVVAGEEVIIAKAGRPVARLVALEKPAGRRKLGILAGEMAIPDGFDASLPDDVLVDFEGR